MEKYTGTLKGKKMLEFSVITDEDTAQRIFKYLAKIMDYEVLKVKKIS